MFTGCISTSPSRIRSRRYARSVFTAHSHDSPLTLRGCATTSESDNAFKKYHTFFSQLTETNTPVHDYYDGATVDFEEQVAD